jgi:MFS family permease
MGIWVMTFQGSSLFGAILSGWLADVLGVRAAMLIAALALGAIGVLATIAIRRADWRMAPASPPVSAATAKSATGSSVA